ncbi:MAG: CoA transferase [Pseudomonadota bacterium]
MERTGPLADLTVIDCTMAYAGPFGTALLADMGANVIKVEPPGGDTFRHLPPFPPDHARLGEEHTGGADYGMSFASVNGNKRGICLDLKEAADREVLLKLCGQADAIVENMRAGVMDELGVGYEVIAERNPRIVYGAVRGYGDRRTGESPYSDWPCLDVAGQSAGGLVEASGDLFEIAIADIYPGTLMALGLLAAVHRARETGRGDFFDVAMYDSMLTLIRTNVTAFGLTGVERKPGNRALVPFGLFPAKDGRIAIAAPVERHWASLCEAMERPDLISDERTRSNPRRVKNRNFTEETISAWTQTRSKAAIVDLLGGKVPCGPANTLTEIFADPHVEARGMLESVPPPGENPDTVLTASPIKFLKAGQGSARAAPTHGQHAEEVFREFGIQRPESPSDASEN